MRGIEEVGPTVFCPKIELVSAHNLAGPFGQPAVENPQLDASSSEANHEFSACFGGP